MSARAWPLLLAMEPLRASEPRRRPFERPKEERMWLYLPENTVTESPLPREPEGSSSVCLSQYRDIELFAGSSETHTPRPLSWPGWRTRPWIRLLSGLTLPPSTAARGAEKWISSLPATPASLSARPGNASGKKTPGTSGRMCGASSASAARPSSSLKTCLATSPSASKTSVSTFSKWVTRLRRESLARQKSARATSGKDCSYWPTPIVSSSGTWPRLCLQDGRLFLKEGKYQLSTHLAAVAWTCLYKMGMGSPREHSLPLQMTLAPGRPGLPYALDCNPQFLEALMGWPAGWTAIDSPVTGLSPWRQAMRSRLSHLLQRKE